MKFATAIFGIPHISTLKKMTKKISILSVLLLLFMFTGCDFVRNTFTYKDKTAALIDDILKQDYDKAISHFAMEHEMAKGVDPDKLKKGFIELRTILVKNFGTHLNYRFMEATKKWSSEKNASTAPGTTLAYIEFSNDKDFSVFKVIFDDKSGKILNLNIMDVKRPIPNMVVFWLFGLVAIWVPVFNIYMIRKVKRSNLKKKWLKYLAILFLNVPAITYAAGLGLSIKLLTFQFMLGISFSYMGYMSSYWTFGLPLGALYWFWKLKRLQREEIIIEPLIAEEQPLES